MIASVVYLMVKKSGSQLHAERIHNLTGVIASRSIDRESITTFTSSRKVMDGLSLQMGTLYGFQLNIAKPPHK